MRKYINLITCHIFLNTLTGFHSNATHGDDNCDDDNDCDDNHCSKTDTEQETNGDDSKNRTKTVVIIVCVLVVLLLIGVIIFIAYRFKNRYPLNFSNRKLIYCTRIRCNQEAN